MPDPRQRQAALNSASWCAALCGCHGDPGRFDELAWLHVRPTPRFYPNAVTLDPRPSLAALEELWGREAWTIKDSYARLDVRRKPVRELFTALWLWRMPRRLQLVSAWERVRDVQTLESWELAWRESAGDHDEARVFPTQLLADEDTVVLALREGGRVRAGVIAHRAASVVGISNAFDLERGRYDAWLPAVTQHFPGLPLVGYERGAALDAALCAGFIGLGPLRVWERA